jgi:hypothetical protein
MTMAIESITINCKLSLIAMLLMLAPNTFLTAISFTLFNILSETKVNKPDKANSVATIPKNKNIFKILLFTMADSVTSSFKYHPV